MRRLTWKDIAITVLAIPVLLFGVTINAQAYSTSYVLGSTNFTHYYRQLSISADGRFVAFASDRSDLVSLDTNNKTDLFVKDMQTGSISLLTAKPNGDSGGRISNDTVKLTGNGRYALFNSESTNLTSDPPDYTIGNSLSVYIRDIQNGETFFVAKGMAGSGVNQWPVGVSEDGRFAYYYTQGPTAYQGLFVQDRVAGTTQKINLNDQGVALDASFEATNYTTQRQVSCDGRFVVGLTSAAFDYTDSNLKQDVYLFDRMNGQYVKNLTPGSDGNSSLPEISCDGNHVLFGSQATNLIAGDTNGVQDLYKYNIGSGSIERVSLMDDETEYGGTSTASGGYLSNSADMSYDGRYVFFVTGTRGSTNRNYLMMRDTLTGSTTSVSSSGSNHFPWNPVVSFDGRILYYVSTTTYDGQYPTIRIVTDHII